jgi:hypothetical protein
MNAECGMWNPEAFMRSRHSVRGGAYSALRIPHSAFEMGVLQC